MPSAIRPLLGLVLMLSLLGAEVAHAAPERVEVVVGAEPGKKRAAERLVRRIGGDVGLGLPIVHGFTARVPAGSIARLRRARSVRTVARDVPLTLSTAEPLDAAHTIAPPPAEIPTDVPADVAAHDVIADAAADASAGSSLAPDPVAVGEDAVAAIQDAATDTFAPVVPAADDAPSRARASLDLIRASAGARGELTGAGVDVALIDSGVLGVAALDGPRKLVRGPDFSEDAYDPDLRGLDAFGHGSHMAGVIAGGDAATGYKGIAPGARLVSVKVAGADGITSLVRVLLALDWVRRNRNSDGLRIRVLNLSFGVDARRSYVREPLAYAAEQLWNRGVTVVAAAGNNADGTGSLDLPAADPFLNAVGATDTRHTDDPADDTVADFSSRDAVRPPDVLAPGTGVVSLRVPGSTLDEEFPAARIGDGFFRGSGTSQAAAVVSGLVARLLQARPELTPDQVKELLKGGRRADGRRSVGGRRGAGRPGAHARAAHAGSRGAAVRAGGAGPAPALGRPHGGVARGRARRGNGGERLDRTPVVRPALVGPPVVGPQVVGKRLEWREWFLSLDPPILAAPRRRGSPPGTIGRAPKGHTLRMLGRSPLTAPTAPRHPRMIGGSRLRGMRGSGWPRSGGSSR
jgi:Subtilase family